jgi:hypothetical protein
VIPVRRVRRERVVVRFATKMRSWKILATRKTVGTIAPKSIH